MEDLCFSDLERTLEVFSLHERMIDVARRYKVVSGTCFLPHRGSLLGGHLKEHSLEVDRMGGPLNDNCARDIIYLFRGV